MFGKLRQVLGRLVEAGAAARIAPGQLVKVACHLFERSPLRIGIRVDLLLELRLGLGQVGQGLFTIARIVAQALFEFGQLLQNLGLLLRAQALIGLNLFGKLLHLISSLFSGGTYRRLLLQHGILGVRQHQERDDRSQRRQRDQQRLPVGTQRQQARVERIGNRQGIFRLQLVKWAVFGQAT